MRDVSPLLSAVIEEKIESPHKGAGDMIVWIDRIQRKWDMNRSPAETKTSCIELEHSGG